LNYAQDYTGGVMIGNDFLFKNDGKLGINTSTPLASLDVRGPDDNTPAIHASGAIQIENSKDITPPSSRAFGYLSVSYSDTMIGGNLRLDDSVTGGTHSGYASGTNLRGGSGIKFTNITGGGADGSIIFVRQNDSNDDTWTVKETARFNATGLFGVGTDSPSAQIHAKTPDIGSTQGSQSTQLQLSGLVEGGANSKLLFQQERIANSTGWQDVKNKIVKAVDGTEMGYISFGENTGSTGDLITFGKNTEEHMRIRSDGNVGIGTNSPTKKLLVENSGQADDNCVVGIVAGTTGYAALDFGDSADRDRGTIFYDNNDDSLNIQAGDTIGIELDSSKRVGLNSLQAKNYHPDADELVLGKTSGTAGMTIRSEAGHKGNIFFADLEGSDTNARYRGIISYDHADEQMVFGVNGEGYLSNSDAKHSGMVIGANGVAIVPATDSSGDVSITEALQVTGNITATGNVTAAAPTADTHLVTKGYLSTDRTGTYRPGEIIEQFGGPCDGRSVTVVSGTQTLPNVTGKVFTNGTTLVEGCKMNYTPPTGTKYLRVEFTLSGEAIESSGQFISYFYPAISNGSTTTLIPQKYYSFIRGDDDSTSSRRINIHVVGTYTIDSNTTETDGTRYDGKLNSWTTSRAIGFVANSHSGSYDFALFEDHNQDTAPASIADAFDARDNFVEPHITITAIA
jgi:hypothetical protein